MMSRGRKGMWGALLVGLAAAGLVGFAADGETGDAEAPRPIHADGKQVEQATLDVSRALLREDAAAVRKALDRIAELSRKLRSEEEAAFGRDIVRYDQVFHETLNRCRELAGAGRVEETFDQFVWVQRTCRVCHRLAREQGIAVGGVSAAQP